VNTTPAARPTLRAQWIEHSPDILHDKMRCGQPGARVLAAEIHAEPSCPCGIRERHTHCAGCGRLVSRGDWDAPPIASVTWRIPKGILP